MNLHSWAIIIKDVPAFSVWKHRNTKRTAHVQCMIQSRMSQLRECHVLMLFSRNIEMFHILHYEAFIFKPENSTPLTDLTKFGAVGVMAYMLKE